MVVIYHKQYILHVSTRQKCHTYGPRLLTRPACGAIFLAGLLLLTACDAVQVIENADTHVSVRYDGMMNGLDQATELAKTACARHGRIAKLQRVYYEGLGAGERFAFFECV